MTVRRPSGPTLDDLVGSEAVAVLAAVTSSGPVRSADVSVVALRADTFLGRLALFQIAREERQ